MLSKGMWKNDVKEEQYVKQYVKQCSMFVLILESKQTMRVIKGGDF